VLGRSEAADLARLAALAGRIFHAPVAYVVLVQPEGQATCRIGAGTEYREVVEALPAAQNPASPVVVQDLPDDFADLNFVAIAPIETLCRKRLGMLVIADRAARPAFTAPDLGNLADLAFIFADRIEMRMIAAQAVITKSLYREAVSPNLLRPEAVSACQDIETVQRA
jgi:hypothetical protein